LPHRRAVGSTSHVDVGVSITSWQVQAVAAEFVGVVAAKVDE